MAKYSIRDLLSLRGAELSQSNLQCLASSTKIPKEESTIWQGARLSLVTLVEKILDGGGHVDDLSDMGNTALHIAVAANNQEVVSLLLSRGADVHIQDLESGWTPLHLALYYGFLHIAVLLIKHGAILDPNEMYNSESLRNRKKKNMPAIDHDGNSPLDLLSLNLKEDIIYNPTCGAKKSFGGDLYTFGKSDYQLGYVAGLKGVLQTKPKRVETLAGLNICDISASKSHCACVTAAGEIYVWGNGRGSRLGLGNDTIHMEPVLLESLSSVRVIKISTAENHTLALSSCGAVYSWGLPIVSAALGHGENAGCPTPKKIDVLKRVVIAGIATGSTHSVAYSDVGVCYTWGSNKSGQLGIRASKTTTIPKQVTLLSSSRQMLNVIQADAADDHTVIITQEGCVYTWGNGSSDLCRVYFDNQPNAKGKVGRKWYEAQPRKNPLRLVQVSCSKLHNAVLSSEGEVFAWTNVYEASSSPSASPLLLSSSPPNFAATNIQNNNKKIYGKVVKSLRKKKVIHISVAVGHSAAVTEEGDVFSWGSDNSVSHDAIGTKASKAPKRISRLKRVSKVIMADNVMMVLVSSICPPLPKPSAYDAWEEAISPWHVPCQLQAQASTNASDIATIDEDVSNLIDFESTTEISSVAETVSNSTTYTVPSLRILAAVESTKCVDVRNVLPILSFSDSIQSHLLTYWCAEFVYYNLDAVLSMARRDDLYEDEGLLSLCHLIRCRGDKVARDFISNEPCAIDLLHSAAMLNKRFSCDDDTDVDLTPTPVGDVEASELAVSSLNNCDEASLRTIIRKIRSIKKKLNQIEKLESRSKKFEEDKLLIANDEIVSTPPVSNGATNKSIPEVIFSQPEQRKIHKKFELMKELETNTSILVTLSELLPCGEEICQEIDQVLAAVGKPLDVNLFAQKNKKKKKNRNSIISLKEQHEIDEITIYEEKEDETPKSCDDHSSIVTIPSRSLSYSNIVAVYNNTSEVPFVINLTPVEPKDLKVPSIRDIMEDEVKMTKAIKDVKVSPPIISGRISPQKTVGKISPQKSAGKNSPQNKNRDSNKNSPQHKSKDNKISPQCGSSNSKPSQLATNNSSKVAVLDLLKSPNTNTTQTNNCGKKMNECKIAEKSPLPCPWAPKGNFDSLPPFSLSEPMIQQSPQVQSSSRSTTSFLELDFTSPVPSIRDLLMSDQTNKSQSRRKSISNSKPEKSLSLSSPWSLTVDTGNLPNSCNSLRDIFAEEKNSKEEKIVNNKINPPTSLSQTNSKWGVTNVSSGSLRSILLEEAEKSKVDDRERVDVSLAIQNSLSQQPQKKLIKQKIVYSSGNNDNNNNRKAS